MTRAFTMLAASLALSASASARSDTDYPHRDWGQVATLDMSVTEATACITRELSRSGSATVIPADGGNDIDFKASSGFFGGTVNEPWQTFKVREVDGSIVLRVFYRHPVNKKRVAKQVEKMRRHCLKVVNIDPAL
ncbi:hypothetical protein [Sphingopyxis sp. 113P3]|uniref:hypothetical protein n=1 Tax=Sphingopyxis sp. (strain 113P3) TaxID=292913 RepID=UPI0006AD21D2|nr:hypothetical protein [Sphingopyxis sp. 113P3]ALC12475.1 hypothetical protein LH20_10985 [Sphingopyxis sp. 113P3]